MANFFAFQSIGEALRLYLQSSYPQELEDEYSCTFEVLSSGSLAAYEDPTTTTVAVTLYLYRVTINSQLRNQYQPGRQTGGRPPALPVELHWMMSVWSTSAAAEQSVFAWAMSQLSLQPLLDSSMLPPEAGWTAQDLLHVLPEEMQLEDVMRVWEALEPSYRLSYCYVTRVVPLEEPHDVPRPAVATRFELGEVG